MAGGYTHNPQGPEFLARELHRLQAELSQLRKMVTGLGIQIDPATNSLVVSSSAGRSLRVVDSTDGRDVSIIGALPPEYNRADGSRQPGLIFYREDGTTATVLADLNPATPPYRQAWQVMDRAGHVVFADDTNGGEGIALPYLCFATPASNDVPRDTTTSSTFVTLQSASGYWMNAKILGQILIYSSDAATTGQVRIIDENSTQIGATITVSGNAFQWVNWGPVVAPGHFGDSKVLNFQARRTAGTGTIGLNGSTIVGVQS